MKDTNIEDNIQNKCDELRLKGFDILILPVWSTTLYHIEDLGYNPKLFIPSSKGKFIDRTANVKVRHLIEIPLQQEFPYI